MGNSCCGKPKRTETFECKATNVQVSPFAIFSYRSFEDLTPVELFSITSPMCGKGIERRALSLEVRELPTFGQKGVRNHRFGWTNQGLSVDQNHNVVNVKVTDLSSSRETGSKDSFPEVFDDTSFPDFMMEFFHRHADSTAVIDASSGKAITYACLKDRVRKTKIGLEKLQFRRGDVVCKFAPSSVLDIVLLLAVTSIGAVFFALDPQATNKETLEYILKYCNVACICTSYALLDDVLDVAEASGIVDTEGEFFRPKIYITDEVAEGYPSLSSIAQIGDDEKEIEKQLDLLSKPAVYLFNEDSLNPIVITHASLITGIRTFTKTSPFSSEDAFLPFTSRIYGFDSLIVEMACLVIGGTLLTLPKLEPVQHLEALEKYQVTSILATEAILHFLTEHPIVDEFNTSSISQIFCSTKGVNFEREKRIVDRFNVPYVKQELHSSLRIIRPSPDIYYLRFSYGMAVDRYITLVYGFGEVLITHTTQEGRPRRGSVGKPLDGVECKCIDMKSGIQQIVCKNGQVCIRSTQMFEEYLNNKIDTLKALDEKGWFHTDDYGYIDEEGFLFIVDDVANVPLREQESELPESDRRNTLKQEPRMSIVKHTML